MNSQQAVQAFWKRIRKGRHVRAAWEQSPKTRRFPPRPHQCKSARIPSQLAAHRAALEHDYFRGNPVRVRLVREAAREYDALMAREGEARKRNPRHRLTPMTVDARRETRTRL